MNHVFNIASDIANGKNVNESDVKHILNELQDTLMISPSRYIATMYFNLMMYTIKNEIDYRIKSHLSMRLLSFTREYIERNMIAMLEDNIGVFLEKLGEYDAAMYHYKNAWNMGGESMVANHLGHLYLKHYNSIKDAKYYLTLAESHQPYDVDTLNNCLLMHVHEKEFQKALEYGKRLINLSFTDSQQYSIILINIASIYASINQPEKSLEMLDLSLSIHPLSTAHTQRIFQLLHDPDIPMSYILSEHNKWIPYVYNISYQQRIPRSIPNKPLKIGFISGELFNHPIIDFMHGILTGIKSYRFHVSFFLGNTKHIDRAQKEYPFVDWNLVTNYMSLNELHSYVNDKNIDILIDIDGHTSKNHLDLFALRAAPIQATYLGYPGTTGLPTMDYRITDPLCDDPETENQYTEKLIYMQRSFLLYTPRVSVDIVPHSIDKWYRIGFMNRLNKINNEVISIWIRILKDIPTCRLVIKSADFSISGQKEQFLNRINNCDRTRIELVDGTKTHTEHIAFYNNIDIALDPFPYSGTTSTCEALYMGVPVVTLRPPKGKRSHRQEVSASILEHSGLQKYVAYTEDEYISILKKSENEFMNKSFTEQIEYKQSIRSSFINGTVCQQHTFIEDFSDVLEKMAKRNSIK